MARRTRTPLTHARVTMLLPAAALLLAGCSGGDPSNAHPPGTAPASDSTTDSSPATDAPADLLRIDATVPIPGAGTVVATRDRLWVISGGKAVVTQVDPTTNTITRRTRLPHPVAYGTLAHGSLWLVSMYDNALIELDAQSGAILRTLERSPGLPLDEPTGIAATGHELWVVSHANSRLLGIDESTGTLTHKTQLSGDAATGPLLVGHDLWVAMTAQGIWHRIEASTGKVVGTPIHVPTGVCSWASVVGRDIWSTSMPFADFACRNGTSRTDTRSGQVTELASAAGKSLYTFAAQAGRLWATDQRRSVYRVDPSTGTLTTAMTFEDRDANHLYTAFGSLWLARPSAGQLLRLATQENS